MSEGRPAPIARERRFYLDDMIGFAGKVLAYTHDVSRIDFERGGLVYDATLRNLELLGEAASRVPDEVRSSAADIPWRMIVATRNGLAHGSGHRQRYSLEHHPRGCPLAAATTDRIAPAQRLRRMPPR